MNWNLAESEAEYLTRVKQFFYAFVRVCIFFGPDRTNGPGYTDHVHPQYYAH